MREKLQPFSAAAFWETEKVTALCESRMLLFVLNTREAEMQFDM